MVSMKRPSRINRLIKLKDMRICGIPMPSVEGELREDGGTCDYNTYTLPKYQAQMMLYPDVKNEDSAVLYGLLRGISGMGRLNDMPLKISGVDKEKPWCTYEGTFILQEWMMTKEGKSIAEATLNALNVEVLIDKDKQPKLQPMLSEKEVALIIAGLIRLKRDVEEGDYEVIERAINHLEKIVNEGK